MGFDFEKLDVYQESLSFADSVYELTAKFPTDETYGITAQLRRAAVSVAVNIAEGSGRSKKEFAHYLRMARTSIWECVPLLTISQRQGYLGENGFGMFYRRCESLSKMLSKLINSIRRV
ncbi:MAG: four helix bundle protein [Acidiferrobacterales bacterium]